MSRHRHSAAARVRGLSLIELMVGMVLGLMLSGAAIGVFLSNKQVFTTTDNLGRMQDNGRFAFEALARDIREAGGNPCSRHLPIANTLNNAGSKWWSNWGEPVRGSDGAPGASDSIQLKSGSSTGLSVVSHDKDHGANSAEFKLNTKEHDLRAGDILMVCDYRQASIFQMTGPNATNATVVHNKGTGTPGNCSKGLGFPTDCSSANGNAYSYGANSTIVKLQAVEWYVDDNGRDGRSLFRRTLRSDTAPGKSDAEPEDEEMVDGVAGLQLSYLLSGDSVYRNASAIGADRWRDVIAVRVDLDLVGDAPIGTDGNALSRGFSHIVTLRNRNP